MSLFLFLFIIIGTIIDLFGGLFIISSLSEKRPRATLISVILLIVFTVTWFGLFSIFSPYLSILVGIEFVVADVVLMFFVPIGRT